MSDKIKAVHDLGYEKGKKVGEAIGEARGEARGLAKGQASGITIGTSQTCRNIAMKMIEDGDSNSKITHLTNLTDKEINDLRNNGKQMI